MNGQGEPSVATEKVDTAALAHSIASAGKNKSEPAPAPSQPAPESGKPPVETEKPVQQPVTKPTEKPPAFGQPAVAPAAAAPVQEQKPTEKPPMPTAEEAMKAENAKRTMLGLPPREPDTVDALKGKYEESSKEAHRLTMERKIIEASLKELGVELVRNKDGKYGLKANEEYFKTKIKDDDLPDIFATLSEDQKLLVDDDVAKEIVKRTLAAVSAKKPPVNVTDSDRMLPDEDVNGCFGELLGRKMPDQSPVFPGLDDPAVQQDMRLMYDDPSLQSFKVWANQSKDNMTIALNLLHGAVYRTVAPRKAAQRDDEENRKKKQEEAQSRPSTLPASAGGQTGPKGGSSASDVAHRIASAERG